MKKEVNNKAQNGYVAGGTTLSRDSKIFRLMTKKYH